MVNDGAEPVAFKQLFQTWRKDLGRIKSGGAGEHPGLREAARGQARGGGAWGRGLAGEDERVGWGGAWAGPVRGRGWRPPTRRAGPSVSEGRRGGDGLGAPLTPLPHLQVD